MQIKDLIPWGRGKKEVPRNSDDNENPLMTLQRDINRVFDGFWNRFERPSGGWNGFSQVGTPTIDVSDNDDEIEVSVELPGMDEKDIDVSVTRDLLTVRGEKKAEREEKKRGYYLSERSYGAFYRSIPLPAGVETDKAKAEFKKGVLTISLPKTPEAQAQAKRIEVKAD